MDSWKHSLESHDDKDANNVNEDIKMEEKELELDTERAQAMQDQT